MIFTLVISALYNIVVFNFGMGVRTGRPVFDAYLPSQHLRYQITSPFQLRSIEIIISLAGLYLLRNFPRQLRIFEEYVIIISMTSVISWFGDVIGVGKLNHHADYVSEKCTFLQVRMDFFWEMIRSAVICLVLTYYASLSQEPRIPSDRMHSFREFLHDVKCLEVFEKYLHKNQPHANEDFEDLVRSMEITDSGDSKDSMTTYGLEEVFREYRRTKSYKKLKELRLKEEAVESIGYTIDR